MTIQRIIVTALRNRFRSLSMISLLVLAMSMMDMGVSQFIGSYSIPSQIAPPGVSRSYYPPATLHYVNIGSQLAGDYKFGYDTGKGPMGQSFREEIRLADGTVKGTYGVVDELGHRRVVHYTAGKGGFVAEEEKNSAGADTASSQPRFRMQQIFNSVPQRLAGTTASLIKSPNYLQTKAAIDAYTTPLLQKSPTEAKLTQTSQQGDATSAETGTYKLRRQKKIGLKFQRAQKKKISEEEIYDPKVEDEYYDSAPAFVDIERLSYSIGSDRNPSP